MAVTIRITVEDVDQRIADGYVEISLESAASASGVFSPVDSAPLANGTYHYDIDDAAGDLNTWYRYRFTGTSGGVPQSAYSNVFQPDGLTLRKIRQWAINHYGAGAVLLAADGGDADTIITNDPEFKSAALDDGLGSGGWVYVTTGARAGEMSRITDASDPATGKFELDPDLTGGLGAGDEFEWHWLVSPRRWNWAINRGFGRYWHLERVPIVGTGKGEIDLSELAPWLEHKDHITGIFFYPVESGVEQPWAGNGRWWNARQDRGQIILQVNPAPGTDVTLYLEAERTMPELYTDAAVAPNDCDVQYIAALAYDEVLAWLTRPNAGGAGLDREAWREERVRHASQELNALIRKHRIPARYNPPLPAEPPATSPPFTAR